MELFPEASWQRLYSRTGRPLHSSQGTQAPPVSHLRSLASFLSRDGVLRQTDVKGGSKLSLTFDIWDTRPLPETTAAEGSLRRYSVAISRGTNRQEVLLRQEFSRPGRYTVQLPLSPPEKTLLVVGMTTDHAQYFEETLMLEVSTKFYIWIKYLVLIPLALLIAPLLFIKPQQKF
jgi:hypothetical protein